MSPQRHDLTIEIIDGNQHLGRFHGFREASRVTSDDPDIQVQMESVLIEHVRHGNGRGIITKQGKEVSYCKGSCTGYCWVFESEVMDRLGSIVRIPFNQADPTALATRLAVLEGLIRMVRP